MFFSYGCGREGATIIIHILKGDHFFLARSFPVSHLIAYTLVEMLSSTIGRDPLWFSVESVARREEGLVC
jgi:hypothetical protein